MNQNTLQLITRKTVKVKRVPRKEVTCVPRIPEANCGTESSHLSFLQPLFCCFLLPKLSEGYKKFHIWKRALVIRGLKLGGVILGTKAFTGG
jgi:hypothetical protein